MLEPRGKSPQPHSSLAQRDGPQHALPIVGNCNEIVKNRLRKSHGLMVMISRSQSVFPIPREGSEFDPQCDYSIYQTFGVKTPFLFQFPVKFIVG